jgi:hypothetical protein
MPGCGPAAAGGLRGAPAKLGESSLAVDAFGVVSSGDQELAGDLGANAVQFH